MGTFNILFVLGVVISTHIHVVAAQGVFNVMDYKPAADGIKDDLPAFEQAWTAACGTPTGIPKVVVPKGKTFLLGPHTFYGPCKAKNITVEVGGTLVSPINPAIWSTSKDGPSTWLTFKSVDGLQLNGGGVLDGRGTGWWEKACHNLKHMNAPGCAKIRPATINFRNLKDGALRDVTVQNSAMAHVTLLGVDGFEITNIKIKAPAESLNTDGIHTMDSKRILIADSDFRSGDDCVSMSDRSSFITIRNCHCGPGHGVSIGSIGKDGSKADVEEIHVEGVEFEGTMFGARIKSYEGGNGFCRKISYKNCNFTNVMHPIFIDQFYMDVGATNQVKGTDVAISDVTFEGFTGTVNATVPEAITMKCSPKIPCTGIKLSNINLAAGVVPGTKLTTNCTNAKGSILGKVEPAVTSLISSA